MKVHVRQDEDLVDALAAYGKRNHDGQIGPQLGRFIDSVVFDVQNNGHRLCECGQNYRWHVIEKLHGREPGHQFVERPINLAKWWLN